MLVLTIAIYASFFHDFLGKFLELSPETIALVSRNPVNVGTMLMANIAHGFLIATVILWGEILKTIAGSKGGFNNCISDGNLLLLLTIFNHENHVYPISNY